MRTKIVIPIHDEAEQVLLSDEENAIRDVQESAWTNGENSRAFASLRKKRDSLLRDTDWWASSDLSISEDQTTYRQALRDLPANTADPTDITWPTEPDSS